jgi:hypothetical protein
VDSFSFVFFGLSCTVKKRGERRSPHFISIPDPLREKIAYYCLGGRASDATSSEDSCASVVLRDAQATAQ